jgi:probable F420-dependent oxidoreductase
MALRIGLGLANFPFSDARAFWRWVELCEDSDVDSIWQSDRLVSGPPFLEVMSTMAALAGATRRLKFGMSVAVVPFRDPLVLAKECATIDVLSGGRLLPAFGVGPDVAPEWQATGRSTAGRGAFTDEALTVMARLWSEDRVTFHGRHLRYTDARIAPRPVQQPLPLWIGGSSPAAIRRTARLGTGWLGGVQSPEQVAPVIAAIRAASAEAGRALDPEHYGASFAFRFGRWDEPLVQSAATLLARLGRGTDPRRHAAVGGADEIVERLEEYRRAGASKFVLRPLALGDAEMREQTERLIGEVLPRVHERAEKNKEPRQRSLRR